MRTWVLWVKWLILSCWIFLNCWHLGMNKWFQNCNLRLRMNIWWRILSCIDIHWRCKLISFIFSFYTWLLFITFATQTYFLSRTFLNNLLLTDLRFLLSILIKVFFVLNSNIGRHTVWRQLYRGLLRPFELLFWRIKYAWRNLFFLRVARNPMRFHVDLNRLRLLKRFWFCFLNIEHFFNHMLHHFLFIKISFGVC